MVGLLMEKIKFYPNITMAAVKGNRVIETCSIINDKPWELQHISSPEVTLMIGVLVLVNQTRIAMCFYDGKDYYTYDTFDRRGRKTIIKISLNKKEKKEFKEIVNGIDFI